MDESQQQQIHIQSKDHFIIIIPFTYYYIFFCYVQWKCEA